MITKLVVSLDTAKKLKEKGWTKPTVHCWSMSNISNGEYRVYLSAHLANDINAPTAEEILRELPDYIHDDDGKIQWLYINRYDNEYHVGYQYIQDFCHKSLSEAAAQMWIWCKENNYLEVR